MIRRHRRVAYHGLTYWITWLAVFAGIVGATVWSYLDDSLLAMLVLVVLVPLCVLVAGVAVADMVARFLEGSASPRDEARSLHAANVDLVRELDEEQAAHAVTQSVLGNERARIAAQDADIRRLRQELDHADREIWRLRDVKRGTREYQAPPSAAPAEVTAVLGAIRDMDATVAFPPVSPIDNTETAVFPPVAREVSR